MDTVQSIFLDFDGVILDSFSIKTEAFRNMFHEFGEDVVKKVVDHHVLHGGISRVEKIEYYYDVFLGQPLTPEQHKSKCEHFSDLVLDKVVECKWIPGAEEFIENYFKCVPLFVVSGIPTEELKEIMAKRNMDHYFKRILGSPTKKPIHIASLAREFDLDLNRCVFVGDALTDYDAANVTGTKFIGVNGLVEFPEPTKVIPDCTRLEEAITSIMYCI